MAMGSKTNTVQSKTQAPPPIQRVSLNPETFTSGGLLDDADVVVMDAAFLMWDYNGSVATQSPALGITFRIVGEENDPDSSKDHDQYYSCGKAEDWKPTDDGSGLQAIGAKTGLNNNTNAGLFIASLVNIGVPKTMFDSGNIKDFVGLRVHVNRVPAPERSNATPRSDGRKPEILVATKLLALPGEGGGSAQSKPGLSKVSSGAWPRAQVQATKPNGASSIQAQTTGSASTGAIDEELDAAITEKILEWLGESGTLAKKQIGPKLFAAFKGDPEKQTAAMKRGSSDEFLMGLTESGFRYDGATLTLQG